MTHLLDTDVCIEVLRGRDPGARDRLVRLPRVLVAAVTVAELTYGAARSGSPERDQGVVDGFLAAVDVLDLGPDAAREAGRVRAELAGRGEMIGAYDLLIAGTARAHDLAVVTGNVRELRRVRGLRVEAW